MISNTSSDLKLADKVSVLPGGYQQKFQFSTSTSGNNNNNNDNSNNKNKSSAPITLQKQSTKPFTFYTSGGVVASGCIPSTECTTIIIQRTSSKEIAKNSPIVGLSTDQSSEHIHYEPCSYYNSKQENELTKKIFNNIRSDSALNGVLGGGSGDVVTVASATEKTTSDTSSSCSSSNSSNSSSKSSKSDRQKSPMCRTEDQENAFRQIEDVHNYSKLNRYSYCNGRSSGAANLAMYSSNSSNQDEDEDDEEEEDEGEEEEDVEDDDDDLDYEQHLHAKVRKLSAIGRQSQKEVKNAATGNSAGQKQQQPEINLHSPEVEIKDEIKVEDDGNKVLPDHHARRPMNAFLIFCKRHRGIVKDKYKNFENRSITKILGEWWASLDTNDKKCYVNLAKQNKDAFFSANPNFKWYKLPAPSLRTSNTRPGNIERPLSGSSEYQCDLNDSLTQSPLTYQNINARCQPKKVSYFKLADETQMGELNNLMRPAVTPSTNDALQEALSETSDYFKTGCKRKSSSSFEDPPNTKRLQSDNSFSSSEDDLTPKKSARSCKGKKYQELMNSGQIAAVTPKKQVISKPSRTTISSSNSSNQQYVVHNGHCNKVTSTIIEEPKKEEQPNVIEGQYILPVSPGSYESPSKQQFSFVSFDLEDKIRALPAQCLETYLQRKKNTKRKKKINSKKRPIPQLKTEETKETSQTHQPKTAQEAKEQMVGSQKRKARKESITRRDINSIQNDVQVLLSSSSVNPVVTGGVSTYPQTLIAVSHNATSDLLILAEVAANHTGIAQ